jgi:hypothetical protein
MRNRFAPWQAFAEYLQSSRVLQSERVSRFNEIIDGISLRSSDEGEVMEIGFSGKSNVIRVKNSPLLELVLVVVRLDHVAPLHRKRESQRHERPRNFA